jgi:hypothetical protein
MANATASATQHALNRRLLPIRDCFRLIERAAVRKLPFDRHQPVRRMNGASGLRTIARQQRPGNGLI